MTKQIFKTKMRTGFIVMTFFFALLSPAFFLFATLFLGAANAPGALLCTIAMLVAAMAADYSSKKVNKYK